MAPLWLMVAEGWFVDEDKPDMPGCMAGEPVAVEPEPVAAGRSVGAVEDEVCAKAGAAAKAVTTRQAAICFFSIVLFS
ncbi:hypothetical protein GGR34_003162 [Microvirga flocculans]|uniref:Uncharacterized protein n=1 Tax=Microvirga flocculans TaxID=217168 RepID=A0A7W6IIG1_9HYPH|nr:hypothetical protein [Microvirga flocculans]MBB4041485.1 hypothetical protein [Microvirga flocculans]